MRTKILIAEFVILALVGCVNIKDHDDSIKYLRGEIVDQIGLDCPYSIDIIGNFIVVMDACDTAIFHIFDKNSLLKLGSFGKKGVGPKEYKDPRFTGQKYTRNDEAFIYILESRKKAIKLISINKALVEVNYHFEEVYHLPSELGLVKNLLILTDGTMVGSNAIDGFGKAFFYKTNSIKWIDYTPELDFGLDPDKRQIVYNVTLAVTDKDYIIVGMDYFNKIEVYNKSGRLVKNYFDGQLNSEILTKVNSSEQLMPDAAKRYFNQIECINDKIFALNYNMSYAEYYNDIVIPTELVVLNSRAEFQETLKLDQRILTFAVDMENNSIFGIADVTKNGDLVIYNYNLR